MSNYDIDAIQRSTVIDSEGNKIGSVGQVYLDDATGNPKFVTVNTGLFGTNESFVPVDGAQVSGDEIRVPYTKDVVKDAPNVASDGHIEPSEEDEIFRYYQMEGTGVGDGDVDRDRDVAAAGVVDRDRGVDVDRDRDLDGGDSVVRHEEEVRVGKERVETGRVRLRKHVVRDTKTVEVPVEREEVEVVREPIADGERGGTLSDGDVEVTLTEERPVVQKDVVAKERVGLDKNVVQESQQVQTEVGREEVEVVGDGVDRSSWTDADYEREGYTRGDDGSWLDKAGNKLDRDRDGHIG